MNPTPRGKTAHTNSIMEMFLEGRCSTTDFILRGRGNETSTAMGNRKGKANSESGLGRFKNENERVAALVKFMDGITDAKIVREAVVYRPMLVGCE